MDFSPWTHDTSTSLTLVHHHLQGVIEKKDLLAPAHLVAGADADEEQEGEEYVEVDEMHPPQYYKVRRYGGLRYRGADVAGQGGCLQGKAS